jgi:phosphate transport system permease protein
MESQQVESPSDGQTASAPSGRHTRRTPLSAHGEPMVWITGGGLIVCLGLILWLISLVVYNGGRTFWPK